MEKLTPVTALKQAAEIAGGQSALAKKIGVSAVRMWNWINRDGGAVAEFCPDIEAATGITCDQLCPTVNWAFVRKQHRKRPAKAA